MISDDRFMFHTLQNWDFGADNTGNLMLWENSQATIKKATSLGKVKLSFWIYNNNPPNTTPVGAALVLREPQILR